MKILLLEDDYAFRQNLSALLRTEYEVLEAATCTEALALFRMQQIQLCLLDINLTDGNGYEVCRQIRQTSAVPILFLTVRDDEESLLLGLESGGDDYLVKPFSTRQLLARIRALLRRSQIYNQRQADCLYSGEYCFHRETGCLLQNGLPVGLSATEGKLVTLLLENCGCLVPREKFLSYIWDAKGNYVEDNTLTVHMSRLRKKLGSFENQPYIKTIKGVGYRWDVPVSGGLL